MTTSNSRLSYEDCFLILDKALASPNGLRLKFKEHGDAIHFRLRCHCARSIDRYDNKQTYPGPNLETGDAGHPMHGRSVYDDIVIKVRLRQGVTYADILLRSKSEYEIEELGGAETEEEVEAEPEPIEATVQADGHVNFQRRV